MSQGPQQRPLVQQARRQLAESREKLKLQHQAGTPGIQICTGLSDLLDRVVLDLYEGALAEVGDPELGSLVAIVAHGGYGRRDVAPYSDVDLMLLHEPGAEQRVAPLAKILMHDVIDSGLQLGFSLRTERQARSLALEDASTFTSLAESRLLAGSEKLFDRFLGHFRRDSRRRYARLIPRIEEARQEERTKFGDTVYLLRPNVKRSRGALREIQLLRWIGFARYGVPDPENLERRGHLHREDRRKLLRAREFLLRLRNELHFHNNRAQDNLGKDEQLRLAELWGYQGSPGVMPVEQFMRDYFEHTSTVREIVSHFVETARTRPIASTLLSPLVSRSAERDFRIGPVHIRATRAGLEKIRGDLAEVLRLMDLANMSDKRIDHSTWQAIRETMIAKERVELSREASDRFLSLLSEPARLADLLRRLHQLRVLEKIVPPMSHARNLVQWNEYHKYTVDEHSIRAVQAATEFLNDDGPLGEAYRSLKQKRVLHLALLLHDLGKGFTEDHSEVGRRLAEEVCNHLGISSRESETIQFLVHKHLVMAHIAFRSDLNDEDVLVRFAREVGRPDVLQMLYVLTCADLAAVGPGVLNSWKLDLVTELYYLTREYLASDLPATSPGKRVRKCQETLRKLVAPADDQAASWWDRQIECLPNRYLTGLTPETIAEELSRLQTLPRDEAVAWSRFIPERMAMEYTVGTYESICPGIFHRLTGALASKGQQILTAEIHTLADDLVLDRFYVMDMDFAGEPPEERTSQITEALVKALKTSDHPPTFRKVWGVADAPAASELNPLPSRVRFDNSTSERCTVVTVFAYDRIGLLYSIARALFESGLSVHVAKIATYLDQVADVFYVTDAGGGKVEDEQRLEEVRTRLEAVVQVPQSQNAN